MAQKYMQTFSDRLRLARRDAQLTQKQLIAKMAEIEQAEWRVQVGQTYISELEKPGSDRMPNGDVLRAMAVVLKVSMDWLGCVSDTPATFDEERHIIIEVESTGERRLYEEWFDVIDGMPPAVARSMLESFKTLLAPAAQGAGR